MKVINHVYSRFGYKCGCFDITRPIQSCSVDCEVEISKHWDTFDIWEFYSQKNIDIDFKVAYLYKSRYL